MRPRLGDPLIEVNKTISFEFNGKKYLGHPGDTLASALLSNNVTLVGRSFKYHRPRGIFADGVEEPNALFTLGAGEAQSPNLRASEVELFEGLRAKSQNHLGSLNWDVLRVNDFLSPFIGAGFYYKTFMWPKSFWEKLYEPLIRRAAGLGALSGEDDRQKYDKGYLFCDVLVIGSGMAGLEAARMAGEAGADVILLEGEHEFGGRLIKEQGEIDGKSYRQWRDEMLALLKSMPNVRLMSRTHAIGAYDGGIYGALERMDDFGDARHGTPRHCFWRIRARETLLAAGAHERPIVFRNNDRPGVMLSSAVSGYLHQYGVAAGENIAIFTNNDAGWKLAFALETLGLKPAAVIDPRADHGFDADFPIYQGVVENTKGGRGLSAVMVRTNDRQIRLNCDCLAVSAGFNPNLHLSAHLGAKPVFDEAIAAFIPPQEPIPHLRVIGAANGKFSDADIFEDTQKQTKNTIKTLGLKVKLKSYKANSTAYRIAPLWSIAGKGRAFVDMQNDVTIKDIEQAHRENFHSIEHLKRYTTLGMGTDQGKTANVNAIAALSALSAEEISRTGTTQYRPPYTPVAIAALGAGGAGKAFAAERYLPSHEFAHEQGAVFTEAGLWYRPSHFPKTHETVWRQACDREVNFVRQAVGVCDVSSLGKILLQGKDAPAFLDLIYTQKMSSLKEGKIRYGLMLREDGFVMDDGTCANLGGGQYLITTTTAFAEEVIKHFDFVSQCLMPDQEIYYLSLTDHFVQIAVAGPSSRALLSEWIAEDISNEALPFMSHKAVQFGDVDARIYRVSFSGELGFELALPSRYGDAAMRALVNAAEALGGGQYGLEALNVLRMEKGFLTHAEIDGRVTADDLGMGQMIAPDKDCIGKVMAARSELKTEHRPELVGLKPIGAVQKLLAGAIIVETGEAPIRENLKGHVSSVCYSPTLGHMIGLAFVQGGQARRGDKIRAVDLVRDFDTLCEIVDPVFYDPKGERARG